MTLAFLCEAKTKRVRVRVYVCGVCVGVWKHLMWNSKMLDFNEPTCCCCYADFYECR